MFVEVKLQPACQVVRGGWGSVAGWGLRGLCAAKPPFWTPARGKFTDEMWHRPTECNFKLPHLQERWNQVPNFTMMMSVRIHDSTGLGCQVPLHMLPPPLFPFKKKTKKKTIYLTISGFLGSITCSIFSLMREAGVKMKDYFRINCYIYRNRINKTSNKCLQRNQNMYRCQIVIT